MVLEAVRPIGTGFECRVRLLDGTPDEAIISREEAEVLFGQASAAATQVRPADAEIRLRIESARVRLAYAHDRHFAVSLSGNLDSPPPEHSAAPQIADRLGPNATTLADLVAGPSPFIWRRLLAGRLRQGGGTAGQFQWY